MSKEDDDLFEFKKILRNLANEAKSEADLGIKLIDDASARFEDYSARKKVIAEREGQNVGRSRLGNMLNRVFCQWKVISDGPPLPDPIARRFVEALKSRGQLTIQQFRLVNLYRMVRFQQDGSSEIHAPIGADFRRAAVLLISLLFLGLISALAVWEIVAEMPGGLPVAYTLGALLGYLMRAAYDSAWGRAKIVRSLNVSMRWLRVVPRNN